MTMLNTTLRNGLMLLGWLCLIFSVRAEEVPFLAPQQRPQLEANKPRPADRFLVLAYHDVEDDAADQRYLSVRTSALNEQIAAAASRLPCRERSGHSGRASWP